MPEESGFDESGVSRSHSPAPLVFSGKWRSGAFALCIFLFCGFLLLAQFFPTGLHHHTQTVTTIQPFDASEKPDLMSQLGAAEAIARRMGWPSDGDLEVLPGEEVQVLQMIQTVAAPRLEPLHADPEFLKAVETMLLGTLRAGSGNAPINRAIFDIIRFLPDSEQLSEIVFRAFSLGAMPSRLWLDRSYEKLTPAQIEHVRSGVMSKPVGTIPIWELYLLAIDGSAASQSVLEDLLARARAAEAQPGPRTQSRGLVPDLERLTALRQARSDSSALIAWGVAGVERGNSASGLWAFTEVLEREGQNAEVWPNAWRDLEAAAWAGADRLVNPTGAGSTPRAKRWEDLRNQSAGSTLSPWVDWADRHGLPVPASIRKIMDTYRPPPPITTGC